MVVRASSSARMRFSTTVEHERSRSQRRSERLLCGAPPSLSTCFTAGSIMGWGLRNGGRLTVLTLK